MIRKISFCIVAFIISSLLHAQLYKGQVDSALLPSLKAHYQPEYTFDTPVDKQKWLEVKSGLHVSFVSTDHSYFRTEVPSGTEALAWEATGWKGERMNSELLMWSPDTLTQVHITLNNLVNGRGEKIALSNSDLHLIRYVLSNYPYGSKEAVCGETPYKNGFLMPDRFEPFDRFDLPGKTVRPVWLSVNIPSGAAAGLYTGVITVHAGNTYTDLKIKIHVQEQVLPGPHEWSYRLDLWQNPWVIAWYNHLQPWSEEHKMLLKKHLQLYADAGGKYITTYGVNSPWSDNSYMIEGGMIEWIKKKNGSWHFDYTVFDTYVELAMQVGIDKAITLYTPIPWGSRFRYMDESSGNYVFATWLPEDASFRQNWNAFLDDFEKHLKKKGWFGKTYLGINENEMNQTLAAIKVIKDHPAHWKITYAGDWHKELDTLLDDYSFLYGKEPTHEELQHRAARGATSTFYVCCNPPYPNNFLFSPPAEGRWLSWYAAAAGYNGFLRWAYDAWMEDPVRDARFGYWAAGDCFLVYPGGNSCVRFEKLREGISDYEKISILKKLVAQSKDKRVKELWKEFEQYYSAFTSERQFDEYKISEDLAKGRKMMEELSDRLGRKLVL